MTDVKTRIELAIDKFESAARGIGQDPPEDDAYYYQLLDEIRRAVADWINADRPGLLPVQPYTLEEQWIEAMK